MARRLPPAPSLPRGASATPLRRTAARVAVLLLLGSAAVSGVDAAAHAAQVAMDVTRITATVAVGQDLLVAVYTNASTGYHWAYNQVPGLKVTQSDFPTRTAKPGQPPLVGAPTITVYHLTVLRLSAKPFVVRFYNVPPGSGRAAVGEVIATITAHA